MNNIIKQTIASMRQQPLLTTLSIAGTALAICLIMIVMMTREVKIADFGNEPNRSRTLFVSAFHKSTAQSGNSYSSSMEAEIAQGVFAKLKTPEKTAIYSYGYSTLEANIQGRDNVDAFTKTVNADFFDVFSLDFLEGQPFTKEECASNMPVAILTQGVARKIFGQESGLKGRTFLLANHEYRVAGIVRDVSSMMRSAYAEIWVPLNVALAAQHPLAATDLYPQYDNRVAIMAKSRADFPKIRAEVNRVLASYNKANVPDTLDFVGQPDDIETSDNREWANEAPDMHSIHMRYVLIFAILLIVPAINIASMTQSRLRQRREEIGVRRAFGARKSTILTQVMMESLLQTVVASILGLVLCFILCACASEFIFQKGDLYGNLQEVTFDARVLFSPEIYLWAVFFCLVLNILSSVVPAWRACRANIVESLKN